jgi:hypothetical protein
VPTLVVQLYWNPQQPDSWLDVSIPKSSPSHALQKRIAEFGRRFWADSLADVPADLRAALRSDPQSRRTGSAADTLDYFLWPARQAGLPILAGTDADDFRHEQVRVLPPGFSLHDELAVYVIEGLTPLTALQAATLNPAKLLHATDSLGTVAPGKLADLVLLDADPLADITNMALIRAVVANGRYFDRAALDRLLAEARANGP